VKVGAIATMGSEEIGTCTEGCDAIVSCLGHTMSFKGIWGRPRRLVTDAVRALHQAVQADTRVERVRFVLMNTAGNRMGSETISGMHSLVLGLIRALVPPHADNEEAASYLAH